MTIKLYSRKETGVVVLLCILRWLHKSIHVLKFTKLYKNKK